MHVARSATPRADGERTGQVCLRTGGKGPHFLVAEPYPLDGLLCPQRLGQPVEGIADDPVDAFDTGGGQGSDNQFSDIRLHKSRVPKGAAWKSIKVSLGGEAGELCKLQGGYETMPPRRTSPTRTPSEMLSPNALNRHSSDGLFFIIPEGR